MVAISAFVDDVLDDVEDCNPYAAIKAIRAAMIEWCKITECWQYDHDNITLVATINELDLSIPDGARLRRITNMVNSEGLEVIEKDDRWLDKNVLNWRTVTGDGGSIKYFNQKTPTEVIVSSVPATTTINGLTGVRMVLVPTQDSTEVSDILYEDYKDDIADGAKYRLLRQKGKPWSDPEKAEEYNLSFDSRKRDARWIANKGMSGGVLNVSGHDYNAGTRVQDWYEDDNV